MDLGEVTVDEKRAGHYILLLLGWLRGKRKGKTAKTVRAYVSKLARISLSSASLFYLIVFCRLQQIRIGSPEGGTHLLFLSLLCFRLQLKSRDVSSFAFPSVTDDECGR